MNWKEIELKPCPFCGSKAEWEYSWWGVVRCTNRDCHVSFAEGLGNDLDAAMNKVIARWNTRKLGCDCEKYEDAQREIRYLQRQYSRMAEQYREVMEILEHDTPKT
jgi:hypothetical protein